MRWICGVSSSPDLGFMLGKLGSGGWVFMLKT
jgi:hypothetical protein